MVIDRVAAGIAAVAHIDAAVLDHIIIVVVVSVEDGQDIAAVRHCPEHSGIMDRRAGSLHPGTPERSTLVLGR